MAKYQRIRTINAMLMRIEAPPAALLTLAILRFRQADCVLLYINADTTPPSVINMQYNKQNVSSFPQDLLSVNVTEVLPTASCLPTFIL